MPIQSTRTQHDRLACAKQHDAAAPQRQIILPQHLVIRHHRAHRRRRIHIERRQAQASSRLSASRARDGYRDHEEQRADQSHERTSTPLLLVSSAIQLGKSAGRPQDAGERLFVPIRRAPKNRTPQIARRGFCCAAASIANSEITSSNASPAVAAEVAADSPSPPRNGALRWLMILSASGG